MLKRIWLGLTALLVAAAVAADPVDKPVIGITVDLRVREGRESLTVTPASFRAVLAAGGLPVLLPPVSSEEDIARYIALADGFVFTGGADIDPARYGQEPHPETSLIDPRRERFEQGLMRAALDARKPVLGLCLGMQHMAVACGGTLIQDIPSQVEGALTHRGRSGEHEVEAIEGTRLADLIQGEPMHVRSSHHQSVAAPGDGVVVSAFSPDGIVEGIEIPDHPFALGVQWHPEHMQEMAPNRRIFEALVRAASEERTPRD